jgi:hypothetical protein
MVDDCPQAIILPPAVSATSNKTAFSATGALFRKMRLSRRLRGLAWYGRAAVATSRESAAPGRKVFCDNIAGTNKLTVRWPLMGAAFGAIGFWMVAYAIKANLHTVRFGRGWLPLATVLCPWFLWLQGPFVLVANCLFYALIFCCLSKMPNWANQINVLRFDNALKTGVSASLVAPELKLAHP